MEAAFGVKSAIYWDPATGALAISLIGAAGGYSPNDDGAGKPGPGAATVDIDNLRTADPGHSRK